MAIKWPDKGDWCVEWDEISDVRTRIKNGVSEDRERGLLGLPAFEAATALLNLLVQARLQEGFYKGVESLPSHVAAARACLFRIAVDHAHVVEGLNESSSEEDFTPTGARDILLDTIAGMERCLEASREKSQHHVDNDDEVPNVVHLPKNARTI